MSNPACFAEGDVEVSNPARLCVWYRCFEGASEATLCHPTSNPAEHRFDGRRERATKTNFVIAAIAASNQAELAAWDVGTKVLANRPASVQS